MAFMMRDEADNVHISQFLPEKREDDSSWMHPEKKTRFSGIWCFLSCHAIRSLVKHMANEPSNVLRQSFRDSFPDFIGRDPKIFMQHVNTYVWERLGRANQETDLPKDFFYYLILLFEAQVLNSSETGLEPFNMNLDKLVEAKKITIPELIKGDVFVYKNDNFRQKHVKSAFLSTGILCLDQPLEKGIRSKYCTMDPGIFSKLKEWIDEVIDDIRDFSHVKTSFDTTKMDGGESMVGVRIVEPAKTKRTGETCWSPSIIEREWQDWLFHGWKHVEGRLNSKKLNVETAITILMTDREYPIYHDKIAGIITEKSVFARLVANSNAKPSLVIDVLFDFPFLREVFIALLIDDPAIIKVFLSNPKLVEDILYYLRGKDPYHRRNLSLSDEDDTRVTIITKNVIRSLRNEWELMQFLATIHSCPWLLDELAYDVFVGYARVIGMAKTITKNLIETVYRPFYAILHEGKHVSIDMAEGDEAVLQSMLSALAKMLEAEAKADIDERSDSPSYLMCEIIAYTINKIGDGTMFQFSMAFLNPVIEQQLASLRPNEPGARVYGVLSFIDTLLWLNSALPVTYRSTVRDRNADIAILVPTGEFNDFYTEIGFVKLLHLRFPTAYNALGGSNLAVAVMKKYDHEIRPEQFFMYFEAYKELFNPGDIVKLIQDLVAAGSPAIFPESTSGYDTMHFFIERCKRISITDMTPFKSIFDITRYKALMCTDRGYIDPQVIFQLFMSHPEIKEPDTWEKIIVHPDFGQGLKDAYIGVIPSFIEFLEQQFPALVKRVFTPAALEDIINYRLDQAIREEQGIEDEHKPFKLMHYEVSKFFKEIVNEYQYVHPGEILHYRRLDDLLVFLFYQFEPEDGNIQGFIAWLLALSPGLLKDHFEYDQFKKRLVYDQERGWQHLKYMLRKEPDETTSVLTKLVREHAEERDAVDMKRICKDIISTTRR